jgi:hypothetical protein
LTVRNPWATYTGIDHKYIIRRVNLQRCSAGEIIHSVAVEHALEHKIIFGSKPVREKCGEGETTVERQPPRPSGREVGTSSWR